MFNLLHQLKKEYHSFKSWSFRAAMRSLPQIEEPDEVEIIVIDRRSLPRGDYKELAPEIRQVFDIDISRNVIEYQAQVFEDENGNQFVAP